MATFQDKDHNIVEIEEDHGFEIPTQLSERNHDELVNNGEFNIGEMEQDASENMKSDVNNETTELCIKMEFQSLDDALMCYTNYAKHEGFGIRKSRILKSRKNQMVIGQEFVCSKEGYRAKKYLQRDNRKKPPPDETRMGCKAMIYVSRKDEDKWLISKFTRDHNHVLASPNSARFHRVHRKRTKSQRNLIDVLDESGIRPSKIMSVLVTESGGIDRVGCIERDIQNYLSNKRQKQLKKGDAQAMLNYFKECQSKNPGFFYAIQMDTEELSEKASRSKKHYDTTIEGLQCLFKKLDALKIDDDMTSSTGRLTSMASHQDDDNNNVAMRDPPHVTTKGRPRSIRMKGALELKSNGVTCSTCKMKGHTKRTCTLKNKNMMDNNCQLRQIKRTDFDENNEDIKICGSFYVSSS
nr:protein FAR1-RELATED SEQUENCE 5-like [Ipomoea batatas]